MLWLTIIWQAWIWIWAIQEFYLQLLLGLFFLNLWFGDVPAMALRESRIHVCWIPHVWLYIIVGLSLLPCIQCVDGNDYSQTGNPAVLPIVTQLIYGRLSNLTKILSQDIKENLGFCIKDVWVIWWSFSAVWCFYLTCFVLIFFFQGCRLAWCIQFCWKVGFLDKLCQENQG